MESDKVIGNIKDAIENMDVYEAIMELKEQIEMLKMRVRILELDKIIETEIDNSVDNVTIDDSAKENMTGEVKDDE